MSCCSKGLASSRTGKRYNNKLQGWYQMQETELSPSLTVGMKKKENKLEVGQCCTYAFNVVILSVAHLFQQGHSSSTFSNTATNWGSCVQVNEPCEIVLQTTTVDIYTFTSVRTYFTYSFFICYEFIPIIYLFHWFWLVTF